MIRIAHENIDTVFNCSYDKINTLIVENPRFYREIITQFIDSFAGERGKLIFSDGTNEIEVKESIVFCKDFFTFELKKKINNLLLKQIAGKLSADLYNYNVIYQKGYEMLSESISDFDSEIELNETMDLSLFLKLYNPSLRIESEEGGLDSLIRYINALVEFGDLKLIIFSGIENYFDKEELKNLFKHCRYKEVSVFLLESFRRYKFKNEICVIIDKDLCEIMEK